MNDKFLKPYNSLETEDRISSVWEKSGYFNPDNLPPRHKKPFSIVLPPPNVTGSLHSGHALTVAIEDIMVRYARMQGKKALWIPGTDHAAIATQSKVEKEVEKKEGKRRRDFTREEFLTKVEKFAQESHDTIVNQVKKLGASLDWSREAFTLDEKRNLGVRTAFKKMYDDGLIYRGHRVVNWDPKGQTTISDDEIVYESRKAKLYTFKYSKDIPITISTTRPETKLGDTAIAVHPDDARYKQYIGKEFDTVFAGESIHLKIIADRAVEKDFGTGALGVTPAHSAVDADIATRHGLPMKQVIDEFAKMTVGMEGVKGKKTAEAREAVVTWLKEQGLLEKEEEIEQNVSTAERTGGIIEPLPKLQWFVAVNKPFWKGFRRTTLKKLMIKAVSSGSTKIIPERFEKVYFNWIENLRDWCISRQIWYGHRLPVWYRKGEKGKSEEVYCGTEAPSGEGWMQDEDTLDTWFSSGLWTFSTLGWPEKTADLKTYHPNTILETGSDILFFWVARMILMSTYLLDEVPFKTVYLHGLVRDGQGRKMSKSLGNFVDPLEMIGKYGADAYRMSLVVGVGPGNDSKIGEDKIKAYKNFANKLWNIARFVLTSAGGATYNAEFSAWSHGDKVHISKLDELVSEITKEMDEYKFYLVAEKIYHYVWHEFADNIVEESKGILGVFGQPSPVEITPEHKESRIQFLLHALHTILKILHPFMPFVTEEIWTEVANKEQAPEKLLLIAEWPKK